MQRDKQEIWAKLAQKRLELQQIASPRRNAPTAQTPRIVPGSWPKSAQKNVNVTDQLQTFIDEMDQDPFMSMLQDVDEQLLRMKSPNVTVYHEVATPVRPSTTRKKLRGKFATILEETPMPTPFKHLHRLAPGRKLSHALKELQDFQNTQEETPTLESLANSPKLYDPMDIDTPQKTPITAATLIPSPIVKTPFRSIKSAPSMPSPLNPTQASRIRELESLVSSLEAQLKQKPREVIKEVKAGPASLEHERNLRLAMVRELQDVREFADMEAQVQQAALGRLDAEVTQLRLENGLLQESARKAELRIQDLTRTNATDDWESLVEEKNVYIQKLEQRNQDLLLANEQLQEKVHVRLLLYKLIFRRRNCKSHLNPCFANFTAPWECLNQWLRKSKRWRLSCSSCKMLTLHWKLRLKKCSRNIKSTSSDTMTWLAFIS
jgi:hypothetical protein